MMEGQKGISRSESPKQDVPLKCSTRYGNPKFSAGKPTKMYESCMLATLLYGSECWNYLSFIIKTWGESIEYSDPPKVKTKNF